jgi:hypothetical protein
MMTPFPPRTPKQMRREAEQRGTPKVTNLMNLTTPQLQSLVARARVGLRPLGLFAPVWHSRGTKNWAQRDYARWAPLVTRREGNCLLPGVTGKKGINPVNAGAYA